MPQSPSRIGFTSEVQLTVLRLKPARFHGEIKLVGRFEVEHSM